MSLYIYIFKINSYMLINIAILIIPYCTYIRAPIKQFGFQRVNCDRDGSHIFFLSLVFYGWIGY